MLNVQLARKYSMAVFELAQEEGKLEEYGEQLAEVSRIIFGQADLKAFVTNPQVQPKAKKELLSKLFKEEVSLTVYHFIMFLVDKRRESLLEAIDHEYRILSNAARGIVVADVTVASELKSGQQAELIAKLEKVTGKTIKIRSHIDKSIIGGVIVKMGDKRIDGSVIGRMQALKTQLLAN
ncbi:MAG: ATP synthase F1 subunit delta [Selenomonadaceae bacterium]